MTLRLGVDTGGTFSDFVLLDEEVGTIRYAKVPSTPDDPAIAIRAGLEQLGVTGDASQVTVGTTIATNAVIERRGPKVIYIGNRGFTDVPFIGRLDKERLYDLHWVKPSPLVRRRDCVGVRGRVDHHGDEAEELPEADLELLGEELARLGEDEAETVVAVCLLFSYLRPEHERRVREVVASSLPDAAISLSHEVSPVWREYERASTTIADAFVKPIVGEYVDRVGDELERGLGAGQWNLLASNGGYVRADAAHAKPAQLLLSGLAGGVIGSTPFRQGRGSALRVHARHGRNQLRYRADRSTESSNTRRVRRRLGDPGDHSVRLGEDDRRGWRIDRLDRPRRPCSGSGRRAPAPSRVPSPTGVVAPSQRSRTPISSSDASAATISSAGAWTSIRRRRSTPTRGSATGWSSTRERRPGPR